MSVDGKWNLSINTPMGVQESTLTLKVENGVLTGTQAHEKGEQEIDNGKADGDKISWSVDIPVPMPMTLEFQGSVEGDKLSGNVSFGAFGESTFTGTRA